ncbi:hypothetical protein GO009_14465 [Muricauda sp. TY007]|uniref:hypothetical protein n=1 Tax=Allomuricauda sp. TY007 TaxID=2683200 RepID=UPI0013BFDEC1|nr:hypothetical protein [Muricauda sp. TY007]NDV17225.1 hypothetical protein [Muricauda sp. TY007]
MCDVCFSTYLDIENELIQTIDSQLLGAELLSGKNERDIKRLEVAERKGGL